MFAEEMKEKNNKIIDDVGELTNMISGQARKELEETGKVFHGIIYQNLKPLMLTKSRHILRSSFF
jgi:chemotaxis protein CheX